jgi:hydroxypyruvate reductase
MSAELDPRTIARQIFSRTLAAIDVEAIMRARLRLSGSTLLIDADEYDLTDTRQIIVIGLGKASVPMARAIERLFGARITGGVIASNALTGALPARLKFFCGGHPEPNEASLAAAELALAMLRNADGPNTLVLFLISGGGSSLFEKPIDDRITLADLQAINRALVGCGAVINEMNIVRRRLSAVKGGRLAEAAPRARQISLYISDVNSNDLASVASGPTLPCTDARDAFRQILARYDLLAQFPPHVAALISSGALPEAQPPDADLRHQRAHHLLLDNRGALAEARRVAEEECGFAVEIAGDLVEGEVEDMARAHLERLLNLRARHTGSRICLLSGGEVICPVRGRGQGGRNQEFALRVAINLDQRHIENVVVLSAGTDGIDGNSPAAGAIADDLTVRRARKLGLSPARYLENSDSFSFFNALGDALFTGPTGNNVRDLRIILG